MQNYVIYGDVSLNSSKGVNPVSFTFNLLKTKRLHVLA